MGTRSGQGLTGPPSAEGSSGPDEGLRAYEPFKAGLHRFLRRELRRAEDVEDLVQEVYLRLIRLASSERIRFPKAYVFRVAFNVLYEFKHRRRASRVDFDSAAAERAAEVMADEATTPDERYEQDRQRSQIEQLLGKLPAMQQAVLIMTTREGMSYQEVAQRLGISPSTARVHLYRATSWLRQELSRENES